MGRPERPARPVRQCRWGVPDLEAPGRGRHVGEIVQILHWTFKFFCAWSFESLRDCFRGEGTRPILQVLHETDSLSRPPNSRVKSLNRRSPSRWFLRKKHEPSSGIVIASPHLPRFGVNTRKRLHPGPNAIHWAIRTTQRPQVSLAVAAEPGQRSGSSAAIFRSSENPSQSPV